MHTSSHDFRCARIVGKHMEGLEIKWCNNISLGAHMIKHLILGHLCSNVCSITPLMLQTFNVDSSDTNEWHYTRKADGAYYVRMAWCSLAIMLRSVYSVHYTLVIHGIYDWPLHQTHTKDFQLGIWPNLTTAHTSRSIRPSWKGENKHPQASEADHCFFVN